MDIVRAHQTSFWQRTRNIGTHICLQ